jgi:uncharacterized protein YecT (DUF1311 family)
MTQEDLVRRKFMATIELLTNGPAQRLGGHSFADADKQLNAVYNQMMVSDGKLYDESAADAQRRHDGAMAAKYRQQLSDCRAKARAAQHAWVRYRDAMGDFAAKRWPEARDAQQKARALVTEDRIRELRDGE